jgi:3-hydroxyacyl-[acyl-carrier-protein] dehydratase
MRFQLLDRIDHIEPGRRIKATRTLRPDEEYLCDHFPRFAVMPGVLMLEAMFQAAMWLVLETEDYQRPFVALKEVRNIRYTDFVTPNQTLIVTAEIIRSNEHLYKLKVEGRIGDSVAVSGRLALETTHLVDQWSSQGPSEGYVQHHLRDLYRELYPGTTTVGDSANECEHN